MVLSGVFIMMELNDNFHQKLITQQQQEQQLLLMVIVARNIQ